MSNNAQTICLHKVCKTHSWSSDSAAAELERQARMVDVEIIKFSHSVQRQWSATPLHLEFAQTAVCFLSRVREPYLS